MSKTGLWFAAVLAGFSLCATAAWAEGGKVSKGQAIFIKYRCNSCHSIKGVGVEKKTVAGDEEAAEVAKSTTKPPDLSAIGLDHSADWFARWLQKKELKDGKKHKKMFRGTDAELKTLTDWIATLKMDETGKPKKAAEKATAAETTPAAEAPAEKAPAEKGTAPEGGK